MFRCLTIFGGVMICFSIVYLVHPATGLFDYATGDYRTEWTESLLFGGIPGLIGGITGGMLARRNATRPDRV